MRNDYEQEGERETHHAREFQDSYSWDFQEDDGYAVCHGSCTKLELGIENECAMLVLLYGHKGTMIYT